MCDFNILTEKAFLRGHCTKSKGNDGVNVGVILGKNVLSDLRKGEDSEVGQCLVFSRTSKDIGLLKRMKELDN